MNHKIRNLLEIKYKHNMLVRLDNTNILFISRDLIHMLIGSLLLSSSMDIKYTIDNLMYEDTIP